jgi:hypothetical protein
MSGQSLAWRPVHLALSRAMGAPTDAGHIPCAFQGTLAKPVWFSSEDQTFDSAESGPG